MGWSNNAFSGKRLGRTNLVVAFFLDPAAAPLFHFFSITGCYYFS